MTHQREALEQAEAFEQLKQQLTHQRRAAEFEREMEESNQARAQAYRRRATQYALRATLRAQLIKRFQRLRSSCRSQRAFVFTAVREV